MVVKNKERQQRYLRDHVDPVLKPLIRRALRGSELPSDFKEWIWTQLCVEFGEKKRTAPVGTVPEAIHSLNELIGLSKSVFSTLAPAEYENTSGAYAHLCSAADALEEHYAKDFEREERKKRAAEEARKREEARKLAEEAKKRDEARRLEVEARKRKEEAKRVEADSGEKIKLFMS